MPRNKLIIKIITIISIITSIFLINNTIVYADTSVSSIFDSGKKFIEQGKKNGDLDTEGIAKDIGSIGQVFLIVGIGAAVGVGMFLGFKYMISGTDEKAKIKERLIYYVISIILLISATAITKVIVSIGDTI